MTAFTSGLQTDYVSQVLLNAVAVRFVMVPNYLQGSQCTSLKPL